MENQGLSRERGTSVVSVSVVHERNNAAILFLSKPHMYQYVSTNNGYTGLIGRPAQGSRETICPAVHDLNIVVFLSDQRQNSEGRS